jgi:hypothetical protein
MSEAEPKDRAASKPAKQPVRLTPPPRVSNGQGQGQTAAASRKSAADDRHRYLRWATVIASVLLAVAAVVVFGFLPRWVEEQRLGTSSPPSIGNRDSEPVEPTTVAPEEPPPAPEIEEPPAPVLPPPEPKPEPIRDALVAAPPVRSAPTPAPSPPAGSDRTSPEFRRAMSEGLAALERQDFASARDHLQRAVKLEPDSPEGADALVAAEEGLRLQTIATHREKASELETAERWREALGEYEAVLALDPIIKFAQEGAARSRARADLSDRLDFHLQNPDRLSTEQVLRDAGDLLEEASHIQPAGARLTRQIDELRRVVAIASTPVRVALVSDNLTEVTVYKVGRLGTFERRILELRPGTYTVVGRRSGYRDVRRRLEVTPGTEPEPLTVRCEDKI